MGARRLIHSIPTLPSRLAFRFSNAIDASAKIEEERLPFFKSDEYYPVKIGDVIGGHYQIVAKLGYGTTSTVWLSRNLSDQKYWVMKVHINTLQYSHESVVYDHLAKHTEDHPGRKHVREFHESFQIKGPNGNHEVFVMAPLGMSLKSLQELQRNGVFQELLVIGALAQVVLALDFLHEAGITHTDVHPDNLLIGIVDESIYSKMEELEIQKPSPRKVARVGSEQRGNAMPLPYRAPEVILNMPWRYSVDAWGAGLLVWDLLRGESLFKVYDHESQELNDAHHLAAITALIGPPPQELLQSSEEAGKYWQEDGEWKGPVPLPPKRDIESLVSDMVGVDKENLTSFLECFIAWLPSDRLTCLQAYFHPWLKNKRNSMAK
ncbi:hypothetical protein RJ55_02203 [Drechmeria coniospora]|nr:hypothetical protein RJ55_02203 [Drechmeria coniospora]